MPIVPPPAVVAIDLIPDIEVVAVAWAKADPDLQALLGGAGAVRVATRLPANPVLPFLRVVRVPGFSRDDSEAPVDHGTLQWDAYAAKEPGSPGYETASDVIRTLAEKIDSYRGVVGEGFIMGARIISGPYRVEEPETEWARFLLETLVSVRRL